MEPLQPTEDVLEQGQELAEEIVGEEIIPAETQEDKAWKGRLIKEQEDRKAERERIDAQLRQGGYCLDSAGNIAPLQQQQYQQPAAVQQPAQSEYVVDDLYDETKAPNYIKTLARQEAMSIVSQLVPELVSMFDEVKTPEYEDWADIGNDVTTSLRQLGYAGVTHAKKLNPQALEFAVDAARGKRLRNGAPAPTAQPKTDTTRQEAILAASSVGDGDNSSSRSLGSMDYSSEERQWMKENGMTEQQYLDHIAGPATIRRKK